MAYRQHKIGADEEVFSPADRNRRRRDDLLLRAVDGCLAGCIFLLPFLLGGQHPAGRLLLVALAVLAAVAWTARLAMKHEPRWRWSGVELILFGGVALLVLQMAPLSPSALKILSPHTEEILPLWTADQAAPARLGVWSTVSLTPAATRSSLVMFLAYALLFLVAVERIKKPEDVERLLRWIAISAAVTAAFGLVQYFTSNGKFFWFYQRPFAHTFKVPKAAFGNRNHFAHFLALGTGALIWWLQDGLRRPRRRQDDPFAAAAGGRSGLSLGTTFRVLALGIVAFAVLLSLSRAGAVVAGLAAAISGAVCYRARSLGVRLVAGLAAVCLLIGAGLAIFGLDRVSDRLEDLRTGSIETIDQDAGRRTIWKATFDAATDYPLVGSGLGSFREVAPMYLETNDTETYYLYAESGYLQLALEAGLVGLGLTLAGVAFCGFWCLGGLWSTQSKRTLTCLGAVSAGLAVSAVHSISDFVWYNPACMAVAVILAACACRLWQFARDESGRQSRHVKPPRAVFAMASVGVAVLGVWMVSDRVGPLSANEHHIRYELLRQTANAADTPDNVVPAEGEKPPVQQVSLEAEARMKAELELAANGAPNDARIQLELAACCLSLFERCQQDAVNVMPVGQIRDAAFRSHFPSREALDAWLARAVGEHYTLLDDALRHTRRALALCPLLGEGYLYLGNLCFLENGNTASQSAYLAQAIQVRPFNGEVLFQAGTEAWLAGDYQRGLDDYQRAFRCGQVYQRQIIDAFAGKVDPTNLDNEIHFFLETFQPELPALAYLDERYRRIAPTEKTAALSRAYGEALMAEAAKTSGETAAGMWVRAAGLYGDLEDYGRAVDCATRAVECQSGNAGARQTLAHWLVQAGRYEEAEQQLTWCLARAPRDAKLNNLYRRVVRMRIDNRVQAAHREPSTTTIR